jgi:heme/copper-type cytochrome/quinol oxidase subunit 1
MSMRWPLNLLLALLVTMGLAVGIAAGIQALLPLMTNQWMDDRWLKPASLLCMILPPVFFAIGLYWRRRAKRSSGEGGPSI